MVWREENLLELDDVGVAEVAMTNDLALDMLGDFVAALHHRVILAQEEVRLPQIMPHVWLMKPCSNFVHLVETPQWWTHATSPCTL